MIQLKFELVQHKPNKSECGRLNIKRIQIVLVPTYTFFHAFFERLSPSLLSPPPPFVFSHAFSCVYMYNAHTHSWMLVNRNMWIELNIKCH